MLLGLIALVPVFDVDRSRWPGRALVAALVAAVALQSAIVWDYGLYSSRTAGQIIGVRDAVGRGQRIVTLLVTTRSRFRANPLLHAENWLGVDSGNVVWNNYEALHYYFPVQFKPEIERPHPGDLELVSIHEEPKDKSSRLRDWEKILSRYADSIDVILVLEERRSARGDHETVVRFDRAEGGRADFSEDSGAAMTISRGSIRASPSVAHDPDQPRSSFRQKSLLLLQGEEVGFVFDLGEILGPVFPGK